MCSRSAARPKCRASATATKYSSWRSSMTPSMVCRPGEALPRQATRACPVDLGCGWGVGLWPRPTRNPPAASSTDDRASQRVRDRAGQALIPLPDHRVGGDGGAMLTTLLSFLGACTVIAAVPGPSTALIIRQSVRGGKRAGFLTVLGNETGVFVWGCAAALGLTALLAASQAAYDIMRVVGAGVLLWFGTQSLLAARRMKNDVAEAET